MKCFHVVRYISTDSLEAVMHEYNAGATASQKGSNA